MWSELLTRICSREEAQQTGHAFGTPSPLAFRPSAPPAVGGAAAHVSADGDRTQPRKITATLRLTAPRECSFLEWDE
jgi:hypothetical protein